MADHAVENDDRMDGDGDLAPVSSMNVDFDDFYRSHYRAVVAFAYSLCRSWPVAEEIAQEAFLAAHRSWPRIRAYELPVGWVRRVVANHCASHVRRRVAEAKATVRARGGLRLHSDAPEPHDDALWAAVSSLPSRQAEIIALHYVGGHSISEISELLDIAQSTVRVHMHRARTTLSACLDLPEEE